MNNKVNQEAERKSSLEELANAISRAKEIFNFGENVTIAELIHQCCDTHIATPQVNEEVASGEVVCSICNNSGYYCIGYSGLECDGNAPMLERCDCEIGQPTPSPSNVLVEALRHADEFITNGIEFGYIRMPDDSLKGIDSAHDTPEIIRKALATYSSTDSVTISRCEYEAMKADAERYAKVRYYGYFKVGNAFTTKTLFNQEADEHFDCLETPPLRKSS